GLGVGVDNHGRLSLTGDASGRGSPLPGTAGWFVGSITRKFLAGFHHLGNAEGEGRHPPPSAHPTRASRPRSVHHANRYDVAAELTSNVRPVHPSRLRRVRLGVRG